MISIIIPTYNEADHIKTTIQRLWNYDEYNLIKEIIIADGGSSDNTLKEAKMEGVKTLVCPVKGRAAQMNHGAQSASAEILYFLHADTIPPRNFTLEIGNAIDAGATGGCFMLAFDYDHWFLRANCWFTQFNIDAVRFGDQSLFVTREAFKKAGGFCEKHIVLEDQEIVKRVKSIGRFAIIKKPVITSARKYMHNGIYKTQGIFFLIYFMYALGFSQQQLVKTYRRLIKQAKI
jgi:rSAM/selenodomain-associated transferase 2